eukprot:PhF_6_TR34223/c0_g1_i2/m.50222
MLYGVQYTVYFYSKNNIAYFGSIGICPGVVGPVDYFSVNAQLLGHIGMVHNADAIHTVYYTIYNSTLQGFVRNFMVVVKCTGEYTTPCPGGHILPNTSKLCCEYIHVHFDSWGRYKLRRHPDVRSKFPDIHIR